MDSVYQKVSADIRSIQNKSAVGGGQLRLELNQDSLTVEASINVTLSQAFTVAPTAAGNLLQLLDKVELITDNGTIVSTTGIDIEALNVITEVNTSQRETLAVNTVIENSFEIHYEMDASKYDLVTAIETGNHSKHVLVITFKTDASGIFTGGTISGGPTYNADVEVTRLEALTGTGELNGNGIASAVHQVQTNNENGVAKGKRSPIDLASAGGVARFILVKCYDETGATPVASDNVLTDMSLIVSGKSVDPTTFKNLQRKNERKRGKPLLGSGVAYFDFGDNPDQWLNMESIKQAKLQVSVSDTAPASWSFAITEDFVTAG